MDAISAALSDWMPQQRWYAAKGRAPQLRLIGAFTLPSDPAHDRHTSDDAVELRTLLVMDDSSSPPALYQVPVALRATLPPELTAHRFTQLDSGEHVIDGPHDPAYARELVRMILTGGSAESAGADAAGRRSPSASPLLQLDVDTAQTSVLAVEQSNTSIVLRSLPSTDTATATPAAVICKVFRQLHHGENPDVVLQSALAEAGSTRVPRSVGHVWAEWDDVGQPDGRARGHLAFAQEFLPDAEDAWSIALDAASGEQDFTTAAHGLGVATAEVHRELARLFATKPASPDDIDAVIDGWLRRLEQARAEVPELAAHAPRIEVAFERARTQTWGALQRIHGDFHLGQALRVPGRGWVLLDFEGEPLRPMIERDVPDLVHRDIAGMLRSFDYAAGSVQLSRHAHSPQTAQPRTESPDAASAAPAPTDALAPDPLRVWAHTARRAFLDGYIEASGLDLRAQRPLLDAFELDKAVYESLYESRNRPDWLPIPLAGITRLLDRAAG